MNRATLQRFAPLAALAAAACLALAARNNRYLMLVLSLIGVYALVAMGLDIVYGLSGQVSLGHAAFFAVGAYATAILSTRFGWPFWWTLPAGASIAVALAILIAIPSVRLVHHFLALVTIGFGEVVQLALLNSPGLTRAHEGIGRIPAPAIAGFVFDTYPRLLCLILLFVAAGAWLKQGLAGSAWGRRWLAVRENARAAEACGVHLARARTSAFVLGAVYAAAGGALYACLMTYVSPDVFGFRESTQFLAMVLIGGYGTLWGPLVGVGSLTFFAEYGQQFEQFQGAFYGLAIMAVVALCPRGVVGTFTKRSRAHPRRRAKEHGMAPPPTSGARLAVHGLGKSFGGIHAVAGVNFEVRPSEIVSIIGPNGSGKTTLFNLITGFLTPDSGTVEIDGAGITGLRPDQICRRGVARTFQNLELFPQLTVLEHLLIAGETCGETGLVLNPFAEHLTAGGLDRSAASLAYADRRRLEIARALASGPRLVLLDEPGAGMNPNERRELMEMLAGLRRQGHTLLVIEHDMEFVLGISDRLIALDHGEKIAEGPPEEVVRHPRVVEAYLGV